MANAKCCDRCKNFYIKNTIVIDKSLSSHPVIGFRFITDSNAVYHTTDLCDKCLDELNKWITNKE